MNFNRLLTGRDAAMMKKKRYTFAAGEITGSFKRKGEVVMPDITLESLFNQIIQLPQTERTRLRQMLDKVKESELSLPEQAGPPRPAEDIRHQPLPMRDYFTELQWITDHAREYSGQWVALDGDRLIAHSPSAQEVFDVADADGADQPLFGFVEDPDKVYAGF